MFEVLGPRSEIADHAGNRDVLEVPSVNLEP
jgi:hypothetical protein